MPRLPEDQVAQIVVDFEHSTLAAIELGRRENSECLQIGPVPLVIQNSGAGSNAPPKHAYETLVSIGVATALASGRVIE